ncbi:MAG TPA: 23S rRNA (uracil(1939)-C(5))-methyltransferase RlmD [Chlamydiales bacterium]|nr:23S rRNA (uracil(1939)-C(5))-methyltransferase RlmD [Chlamydiales bacterium]
MQFSSALKVEPRCSHVPSCGGCVLQEMDYNEQLKIKQQNIEETFAGFLNLDEVIVHPIIPCESPWEYRNKMEFSFSQDKSGNRFLGLILKGSKGKVFNLMECHLTAPWFAKVVESVRTWWEESGLHAYRRYTDQGSLRTLTIREGKRTGDKMVFLTVSGNPAFSLNKRHLDTFLTALKKTLPDTASLSVFLRIQQIARKMPTQFYEMHLSGPAHIQEQLWIDHGNKRTLLTFKISPTSFFQPNTHQAEVLYSKALQMVGSCSNRVVFDLYCGIGTLSMAMALQAKQVFGIEINPHAVFDAENNKLINGISNVDVLCGDVGQMLQQLSNQKKIASPDLVMVDPPRSGLDPLALNHILSLRPRKILYISCNPQTQVKDIQELHQAGYQLIALQPVDQFPHTLHIENIALLRQEN